MHTPARPLGAHAAHALLIHCAHAAHLRACRVAWAVTFALSLCKPRKERTFGSMRDLLYISLLFVALKLDGLAAYTWSVVFLIPWMWFGALFLGAVAVSCSSQLARCNPQGRGGVAA